MVNVPQPDLRVNRLLLLGRIRASLQLVADFSLIEDAALGRGCDDNRAEAEHLEPKDDDR